MSSSPKKAQKAQKEPQTEKVKQDEKVQLQWYRYAAGGMACFCGVMVMMLSTFQLYIPVSLDQVSREPLYTIMIWTPFLSLVPLLTCAFSEKQDTRTLVASGVASVMCIVIFLFFLGGYEVETTPDTVWRAALDREFKENLEKMEEEERRRGE